MSKLLAKNPSNIFMGAKKQLVRVGNEWKEGKQIWEKVGTSWIKRWENSPPYDLFRIKTGVFNNGSAIFGFNFNNTAYIPTEMISEKKGGTSTLGIPGDELRIEDGKIPCSLGGVISRIMLPTVGSSEFGSIVIEPDSNGVLPDISEYNEVYYRYGHSTEISRGDILSVIEDPQGKWVSITLLCPGNEEMKTEVESIAAGDFSNAYSPFELMWGGGDDERFPAPFDPGRIKCAYTDAGFGGFNAMASTPWADSRSPTIRTFGTLNVEPITHGEASYTVERLIHEAGYEFGPAYDGIFELILKGPHTFKFLPSHGQYIRVFRETYILLTGMEVDVNYGYVRILFKSPPLRELLVKNNRAGPTPIHFDFKLTG